MTLNQFIEYLLKLQPEHGTKKVFTRHGASGDCNEMGTPHITNYVGDCGPFDLEEGEEYVSVYIGN